MSSNYGLTPYGFLSPTYQDILNRFFIFLRQQYGQEIDLGDNSIISKLCEQFSYMLLENWLELEAVYNSQTINGAEGIYLNDLLSKNGIFRKGKIAGTGQVLLHTDQSSLWNDVIQISTTFQARNGKTYSPTTDIKIQDNITGFSWKRSDIAFPSTNKITFYIKNFSTSALNSIDITPSLADPLETLCVFIQGNVKKSDIAKVFVKKGTTTDLDVLYVGFIDQHFDIPVGLSGLGIEMYASINVGDKWSLIPVVCKDKGYFPVNIGEINNINPQPTGFKSVTNITEFSSGSDVETDAEYRARSKSIQKKAAGGTAPAVEEALSNVSGISKFKVYASKDYPEITEITPNTFSAVVLGGDPVEIATAIQKSKASYSLTSGNTLVKVPTLSGTFEGIYFTTVAQKDYSIKVVYKTPDNNQLTDDQKSAIISLFLSRQSSLDVGAVVYNQGLEFIVAEAVPLGTFKNIKVFTKLKTAPDSSYSQDDITLLYNESITITADQIFFEEQV